MNIDTLLSLIEMRGLSQARLAQHAGISRQTLTAWKRKAHTQKNPNINIFSRTQEQLAKVLGVNIDDLNKSIEIISDIHKYKMLETEILWDKLFKNIETFSAAVAKGIPEALARLVQVYGLYASAKIAGVQIWQKFPAYKNKIHPAYRKQAEVVWMLAQNHE